MANETSLRQAKAKAYSTGVVSDKQLKEVTDESGKRIEGYLTVKTNDTNFVRYNVRVAEKTKAGAVNKAYAGIETVMNEYKSIADVGEQDADRVKVSGDINIYRGQNGEDIVSYKSNFFNRARVGEDIDPNSEFEVEMFVSAVVPEANADGETGRLLIKGWVPDFAGINPLTLVVPEDDADAFADGVEVGTTITAFGDIVSSRVEKVKEIPMAIGKPRRKVEISYKNELVVTGVSEAYDEDSADKPYNADAIKLAIQERENKINEKKSSPKTTTAKPSGAAHGRTLGF